MSDPLDNAELRALHARLVNGDRVASEGFARRLLPPLVAKISRKYPRVDEQLVADGVVDALFDYCTDPESFDADSSVPLDRFLARAAWRNVANLLCGEQRRKQRERRVGGKKREADVGLDPLARNIQREDQTEAEQKRAAMFAALKTPRDREILALWLDGVKDTGAFAPILEITHLPFEEQQDHVYRTKERIIRFLRRRGLLP